MYLFFIVDSITDATPPPTSLSPSTQPPPPLAFTTLLFMSKDYAYVHICALHSFYISEKFNTN